MQASRSATGLLWQAAYHVQHDPIAFNLLLDLRDSLIDEPGYETVYLWNRGLE